MSWPIQIVTHEYPPFRGGIAVYVEETARALGARGAEVTVWAPSYGRSPGMGEEAGIRVRRIRMRGKQDFLCRWRMAAALRRAFPGGEIAGSVLLAEPGPIRLWMGAGRRRLPRAQGLGLILHGSEGEGFAKSPRQRAAFGRLLAESAVAGVVSEAVGKRLADIWPEAGNRLLRIPGAPPSGWREAVEKPSSGAVLQVLQVGRLHPRKGQDLLVEAVARLSPSERERIEVKLVGPVARGSFVRQLRKAIALDQLPVELAGVLGPTALRRAYAGAQVVAFPSRRHGTSVEGLGLAVLEGAKAGCAILAADTGGVGEALRHGKTGFLVPEEDAGALAETLRRFLRDPALARRMGEAGRAFVRDNFSWDRNAAALLEGLRT